MEKHPFVFLDYGELIFHYEFNRDTLARAHNNALRHINSLDGFRVQRDMLGQAHDKAIGSYLASRRVGNKEWPMTEIMRLMLEHLGLEGEVSAENLANIYSRHDHVASPMPHTLRALPRLRKFGSLNIISNLPHNSPAFELERYGLLDSFDTITISGQVGYRKPHPRIYQEAMKKAIARAEESVFFSHDQEEVDGALAVGMQAHLAKNLAEVLAKLKTS